MTCCEAFHDAVSQTCTHCGRTWIYHQSTHPHARARIVANVHTGKQTWEETCPGFSLVVDESFED